MLPAVIDIWVLSFNSIFHISDMHIFTNEVALFWCWCIPLSTCRISPDSVFYHSCFQYSQEEEEDLSVEQERPALEEVIPKDELHNLKKDEKKRQEVINGNYAFCFFYI